jgi:hypothetical protein
MDSFTYLRKKYSVKILKKEKRKLNPFCLDSFANKGVAVTLGRLCFLRSNSKEGNCQEQHSNPHQKQT